MLADGRFFTSIPTVDPARAREFYENTLGLRFVVDMGGGLLFESGSSRLFLYQREEGTKADHTVAGWDVADLRATVRELTARGVVFEQYDWPGLKTDAEGIADADGTDAAWFKDPDGNILGVFQNSGEQY